MTVPPTKEETRSRPEALFLGLAVASMTSVCELDRRKILKTLVVVVGDDGDVGDVGDVGTSANGCAEAREGATTTKNASRFKCQRCPFL